MGMVIADLQISKIWRGSLFEVLFGWEFGWLYGMLRTRKNTSQTGPDQFL